MKRIIQLVLLSFVSVLPTLAIHKLDPKVEQEAKKVCAQDIKEFCPKVNEGDGRLLACMYGHADQISPACEYQMFTIAHELKGLINNIAEISSNCSKDINSYCANIQAGEGKILGCLADNYKDISNACYKTLKRMSE